MINSIQLLIIFQLYYNTNLEIKVLLASTQKHTNPEKKIGCTLYLKYNENKLLQQIIIISEYPKLQTP